MTQFPHLTLEVFQLGPQRLLSPQQQQESAMPLPLRPLFYEAARPVVATA